MSFGKKKSSLPQRPKSKQQVVEKKRIVKTPTPTASAVNVEPDMDAKQTLTLSEVMQYTIAVCEARGYPEDSSLSFGMMAHWLAARGMPSLSFIAKTIFENTRKDLREMGPRQETGPVHIPCPLIATAYLGTFVNDLLGAGPGQVGHMTLGGPAILLASRLSDHAAKVNLALQLAIWPLTGPRGNPTLVTVYENEIAIQPGTGSLYDPSNVAIRVVPPEQMPAPDQFTSSNTHRRTLIVQSALLDLIGIARQSAGLPPVKTEAPANPKVTGSPPMQAETKTFFRDMIQRDFKLQELFSALSKSDLSMLAAAATNNAGKDDLEGSVFATADGSSNDKFYIHCCTLGWMGIHHDNTLNSYGMKTYRLTETGRMGLSVLMERFIRSEAA